MIQQILDDEAFPIIFVVVTSHEAWDILKKEYMGDRKVIYVKLQTLRHNIETLVILEKESVQEFLTRVSVIVNYINSYGENVSTKTVVRF